jgi:hypothetical protein
LPAGGWNPPYVAVAANRASVKDYPFVNNCQQFDSKADLLDKRIKDICAGFVEAIDREVERLRCEGSSIYVEENGKIINLQGAESSKRPGQVEWAGLGYLGDPIMNPSLRLKTPAFQPSLRDCHKIGISTVPAMNRWAKFGGPYGTNAVCPAGGWKPPYIRSD